MFRSVTTDLGVWTFPQRASFPLKRNYVLLNFESENVGNICYNKNSEYPLSHGLVIFPLKKPGIPNFLWTRPTQSTSQSSKRPLDRGLRFRRHITVVDSCVLMTFDAHSLKTTNVISESRDFARL